MEMYEYSMDNHKKITAFNFVISVIAGFLFQCAIYTVMGIPLAQIPVLTICLLWIVFSTVTSVLLSMIGF